MYAYEFIKSLRLWYAYEFIISQKLCNALLMDMGYYLHITILYEFIISQKLCCTLCCAEFLLYNLRLI